MADLRSAGPGGKSGRRDASRPSSARRTLRSVPTGTVPADNESPAADPALGPAEVLEGRIALVTGAGSPDGIGYATARRLKALGASVAIVSTTRRIHDRATELGVTGFVADLTVEAEVGALADAIGEDRKSV